MSDELRRRAAEWRDIEFSLDKIAEHIKAKFGEKWPDDNDKETLKIISEYHYRARRLFENCKSRPKF